MAKAPKTAEPKPAKAAATVTIAGIHEDAVLLSDGTTVKVPLQVASRLMVGDPYVA